MHSRMDCTACHAGFEAREHTAAETQGWYRQAKLTACSDCHASEFKMYDQSFHGNLVMSEGSTKAPACGDCHGSHGIIDPTTQEFRATIPQVCGRCHGEKEATYLDTYHGKSWQLGDLSRAVCTDCHGYHKILPQSDPASTMKQNVVATCGKCHPNANAVLQLHGPRRPQHAPLLALGLADGDEPRPAHRRAVHARRPALRPVLLSRPEGGNVPPWQALTPISATRARRRASAEGRAVVVGARTHFRRFTPFQRWVHFFIMISFSTLVLTGMPLKYSDKAWAQRWMGVIGGVENAGMIHRFAAMIMVLRHLHAGVLPQDPHQYKGRFWGPGTMVPTWQDYRDLKAMVSWFIGRSPRPHLQLDRYAYYEKGEFWAASAASAS